MMPVPYAERPVTVVDESAAPAAPGAGARASRPGGARWSPRNLLR